ncbi:nuclear transport factor 2 family protein [Chitinophaga oryzae]|uniref:Nuclear transport factor 2 family protein n=1 Tax=Chitinophaga oryzae TaxID=2725414 RepID=A0AAE7D792_9BACT|nr:nuclear transport factor 2 family protein [Chitinophaga oryzae]QJB31996.1 nuclear transport factor 2 family protein [Chitinophaga oryzae]QJB38474.1 nuclear transport factor 2 family protein [Chitinophaga oryzae]
MENPFDAKKLLEAYYDGFSKKEGWEHTLSDDFRFIGGDMTNPNPVVGKQAYIEIIRRFSQRFESMRVQQVIVEGDKAAVIANYDFVFQNGARINGNVAEYWTIDHGKLSSLTIFFDTQTFMNNSK